MPFLTTQQNNLPPGVSGGGGQAYTRVPQAGEASGVQLNKLLTSGNPLMQNAGRRGQEVAQGRRLGNSSIAAGASERAMIESAAPFALQQADAVGNAASENLGYLNQYEISDRANTSAEARAETAAAAQRYSADAAASASKYAAETQLRAVEATLAAQGQQADMQRMHDIVMSNLQTDQRLVELAAAHDLDLDAIAANAFYDIQQVAVINDLGIRNAGMSFMIGTHGTHTEMIREAVTGDWDAAATGRLIQIANDYLEGSVAWGTELFANYPEFNFTFGTYGEGDG